LQNNYVPNQNIFSSFGSRYSNAFVTQAVYAVSPRGSITVSGSYGLLRFVEAGNIDSDDVTGSLGYNYALTKNDTLGLLYRFTGYQYSGNPQRINDHVVNVAYGHRVTGRLAVQLFAGPDVATFKIPIANMTDHVSMSGGASLNYAMMSNGSLSLAYDHGVSNGGGILVGSNRDQVWGSMTHMLGRVWQGRLHFGYATNRSIALNLVRNSPSFDSYFVGGVLDHPLGRSATLYLGYTAYIQGKNGASCATGVCSFSSTQHQISLGFVWHTRPYVLR